VSRYKTIIVQLEKGGKKKRLEMRLYVPGEDLSKVFIADGAVPRLGGFVTRNPLHPEDKWYIEQ